MPLLQNIYDTRNVRFVMSTALLFANYGNHRHIVKTCIRRNFQSYPITMHKIVLILSAMWLFDLTKSVLLSTVPEKKVDPKAEQSPQSYGHCGLCKGARHSGLAHPPYNPDFSLCDFLTVPPNNERLAGLGGQKVSLIQDLEKSSQFRAPRSVSI